MVIEIPTLNLFQNQLVAPWLQYVANDLTDRCKDHAAAHALGLARSELNETRFDSQAAG